MTSPHAQDNDSSQPKPGKAPDADARRVGGVRIKTVSIILMVISLVLCILAALSTFSISDRYAALDEATLRAAACEEATAQAGSASDFLTDEARLFVTTGDEAHLRNYIEEVGIAKNRNRALELTRSLYSDDQIVSLFERAIQRSDELMAIEMYAMYLFIESQGQSPAALDSAFANVSISPDDAALTPTAKIDRAQNMLFDEEYSLAKEQIDSDIAQVARTVTDKTTQERDDLSDKLAVTIVWQRIFIVLLIIMMAAFIVMIMLLVIRPLHVFIKRIQKDERLDIIGAYELRYLAATYNDIYDLKLANSKSLQAQAERDALTGAFNRLAYDQTAEQLRNASTPVCLLLVDADNFKWINDCHGHAAGDRVLCRIVSELRLRFRSSDHIARLGGDEFAVLTTSLTAAEEDLIREKITEINDALQNPIDSIPSVSISVGCAFSSNGYSEQLFDEADHALYRVKHRGRKGFEVYQWFADLCRPVLC